ncbi:uncharacterized protein LOC142420006 isoform X6 [Mycteria americana]|uniref:uncharacterized protein LOC142420006 isoform X6 n=1 Tax=Mycteria americana TaxID=33587 RepID=UPI003F5818A2
MRHPPTATHWSPRCTYGCPLGSRRRRPAALHRACASATVTGACAARPARWRSREGAAPPVPRLPVRAPPGPAPRGPVIPGGRRLSPLQHARPADQSLPVSRRCFGSPTVPSSPPVCPSSWASRMAPAAWPAPPPASPPCSCSAPTSGSCPGPGWPRPPSPSSAPTRTGCGASSRPPTPAGSSAPRLAATSPWGSPGTPTPPTSSTSTSSSADPPPVPADGDVPRWGR